MNTDNIHNNNNNSKKVYNKKQQLNSNHHPVNTNINSTTKKTQFQDAVVAKSDVGEFSGGYFIMPSSEQDNLKMKRPVMTMQKTHRKKLPPTVNQLEQQILQQQSQQQDQPIKKHKTPLKHKPQEQTNDDSLLYLTPTFLSDSPKGKQQNSKVLSPQNSFKQQFNTNVNTTPLRSNSPKKLQSPTQNSAWAGGAFNNSPSPSSLPMPNFDDEPSTVSQVDLQSITFDLRRLLNITPTISVSES